MSPTSEKVTIDADQREQFGILFEEFLEAYLSTEGGRRHIQKYEPRRQEGRQNFEQVVRAADRGEDVTDRVLLQLLPYEDTPANKEKGAWIPLAPAIRGDLKKWYEKNGWTAPEEWPRVAEAILDFFRRCNEYPEELQAACRAFDGLSYTTGFQTGMLTPMLNALHPEEFLLINNKSRDTINHFAGTSHSQKLREYAETNATGWRVIHELAPLMHECDLPDLRDSDLFDMFCHWLVAVREFEFGPIDYWKIAPGRDAWQWDVWRDEGFIAIGWDELGDLSEMTREEFDARRETLAAERDDWTEIGMGQAWRFAHIKEGDRVVANHGLFEVLGVGQVIGPYYFVEGERHSHRFPVRWDDLTHRRVEERGWRSTLVNLDREKLEAIRNAPPLERTTDLAEPFSKIFVDREEAEWALDFLSEALRRLGVTSADDKRFSLTLRHSGQVLRLNFGNWAVLQFSSPGYYEHRAAIALIESQVDIDERWNHMRAFDQNQREPPISLYRVPIETLFSLGDELHKAYKDTFDHIAERFSDWQASPYRKYGVPEIAAAVFDEDRRSELLSSGISDNATEPRLAAGYFSKRTFELLEGLHRNPTTDYYMSERDAFESHLMEPFKRLFRDVAETLSPAITEVMETERWLFSRIPKNDFGQGGAWDFYWGAFYPKGSKRTEDAQLSLWMNYKRLEFGFYIGHYGTEKRQRFLRRCREHYAALKTALGDVLSSDEVVLGSHEDIVVDQDGTVESQLDLTWEEWLKHPDQANYDVSVVLPREEVLTCSKEALVSRIARSFERLFPLVLLTVEEEPLQAIAEYLEIDGGPIELNPQYSLAECAAATHFDEQTLAHWIRAIERKNQAILYGPPGTGKTYLAEHLAKHLIGGGDGFSEIVQFHPAYAYEDFIQGLRPDPAGDHGYRFKRKPGRFLDFCRRARACEGRCVLIVDEINRANLSRVFGELMYLLEYRDREVPLAVGGAFRIPKNVRIIGTMNTADRSIALVDHALRRRFAFLALYPDYDVLRRYHREHETGFDVEPLIKVLKGLNQQIDNRHYAVGITFFLLPDLSRHIADIWQMEIEPYLEEYFFDQPAKVASSRWVNVSEKILA